MGIKGLLPNLKSITKKRNIKDMEIKSVAVDGYAWLHRSVLHCGEELIYKNDISKVKEFFLNQITNLLSFGNFNLKISK